MKMTYSQLETDLNKLENQVKVPNSPTKLLGVRNNGLSQVQAFALHSPKWPDPGTEELPVVVTIGANYAQKNENVPRDYALKSPPLISPPPGVRDDVSRCRTQLDDGIKAYKSNKGLWFDQKAASSLSLSIPEDFHLVMTNFCIWITNESWLDVRAQVRANLLVENPLFNGCPVTGNGNWPHLDALAVALKNYKQPVLWVGHGLDSEVFALFRLWAKKRGDIENWLLLPNLSRPYKGKGVYNKTYPCLSPSGVTTKQKTRYTDD